MHLHPRSIIYIHFIHPKKSGELKHFANLRASEGLRIRVLRFELLIRFSCVSTGDPLKEFQSLFLFLRAEKRSIALCMAMEETDALIRVSEVLGFNFVAKLK